MICGVAIGTYGAPFVSKLNFPFAYRKHLFISLFLGPGLSENTDVVREFEQESEQDTFCTPNHFYTTNHFNKVLKRSLPQTNPL